MGLGLSAGRGGPLMRSAVGPNAPAWWETSEGSHRSQWALAEVRPQWQLAAGRTFILTQRESALSKNVWEVWQRGVAAQWLNGNYVQTSASGCGWTKEYDQSGGRWCHLRDSDLPFMCLVCFKQGLSLLFISSVDSFLVIKRKRQSNKRSQ